MDGKHKYDWYSLFSQTWYSKIEHQQQQLKRIVSLPGTLSGYVSIAIAHANNTSCHRITVGKKIRLTIAPTTIQAIPDEQVKMRFNSIPRPSRRSSALSTASASSTSSDLSTEVLASTLPLAPREDDFNMSEKDRAASLLARCRRAATEPWKSAKPLMAR
jgi:hypothetical protein